MYGLILKSIAHCLALYLCSTAVYSGSLNCPCKVVKVTDGDTIHVLDQSRERHKIRLQGIDAPEKGQAYGNKSTQNLARRVAGQEVEVNYNKRDRYGRIIGKVLIGGTDANLAQIIEGYAWHYKKYQREQSQTDQVLYSMGETQARSQRSGLWKDPRPIPPWEYRKAKRNKSRRY